MTGERGQERAEGDGRELDADRRFVDALLLHHFEGDQAASTRRIEAVLRRLDDEPAEPAPIVPASRWLRTLRPVAAAIVLAALMLIPTMMSNTASAALDRAIVAMSELTDHHYRIEIEPSVGRPRSGEIWFRGAEFVALRLDVGLGELWAGEGRDAAWVVPPPSSMPVRVTEKGSLLDVLKLQGNVATPFLRISTLLSRLDGQFELDFDLGPDGRTVEGRRIAGASGDLPDQVRVRLAPDGVVRELEAQWPGLLGARNCRLTWLDNDERPATFYEHATHHDPGREILDRR